jgi:putative tricarboxylic transport membrane protein
MIEAVLIIVLGTIIGIVVGLLPGMGTSFVLVAAYPVLMGWSVDSLLMFYTVITMSSQFSGSVSVLIFGVLGEITGQPAMRERNNLQGHINVAVAHSAQASFVAAIISLGIVMLLWQLLPQFVYVLRNEVKLSMLVIFMALAISWGSNQRVINLGMVIIGAALGIVGYNYSGNFLLTFDQPWLAGGIPFLPLLVGLVALPGALQFINTHLQIQQKLVSVNWLNLCWPATVRGSVIGSIVGLIPIIGNSITSQLAWRAENSYYRDNSVRHSLNRLTAAEAANNSGNVSVMLPLLMFGLPIIPSEMILFNMISMQGWSHNFLTITTISMIFFAAIGSAGISWYLCGPAIGNLVKWTQQYIYQITALSIAIAVGSVLYSGYQTYNMTLYICVLIISCVMGWIFRKLDMTPFLIAYIIIPQLAASAGVVSQLYF